MREAIGPKTRAIIPVHFGGPMADMDSLLQIAGEHGIPVIEDAAHAHGSEWNGRRAGSFGVFGSFSFQNGKAMTAGEGGILLSNDEALIDRAREIHDIGRRKGEGWFFHYTLGIELPHHGAAMRGSDRSAGAPAGAKLPPDAERHGHSRTARGRSRHSTSSVCRAAAQVHTNYLLLGRVDGDQRRIPPQSYGRRISMHALLSAHSVRNPLYKERHNCRVMPCPNSEARLQMPFGFRIARCWAMSARHESLASAI